LVLGELASVVEDPLQYLEALEENRRLFHKSNRKNFDRDFAPDPQNPELQHSESRSVNYWTQRKPMRPSRMPGVTL
jgi:hypothetical protein